MLYTTTFAFIAFWCKLKVIHGSVEAYTCDEPIVHLLHSEHYKAIIFWPFKKYMEQASDWSNILGLY